MLSAVRWFDLTANEKFLRATSDLISYLRVGRGWQAWLANFPYAFV